MKYYRYDPDTNVYNAYELQRHQYNVINIRKHTRRISDEWRPVKLNGFSDNPGLNGDFPTLNDYGELPIFSHRAWEALKATIGAYSEALPVILPDDTTFYLIHVLDIIDCLDEAKSEVRRSMVDGNITRVYRYAFRPEFVLNKHIFRLPIKSGGDLIVSDVFRSICEDNHLKGLQFKSIPMVQ